MRGVSVIVLAFVAAYVYASPIETSSKRQLTTMSSLPTCAFSCGGAFGSCTANDAACLCGNTQYVTNTTDCIAEKCQGSDLQAALQATEGFCMGAGVTLNATSVWEAASAETEKVLYGSTSSPAPATTTSGSASKATSTTTSAPTATTTSSSASKATGTSTSKAKSKSKNAAFSNSMSTYELLSLFGAGVGVIGAALFVL